MSRKALVLLSVLMLIIGVSISQAADSKLPTNLKGLEKCVPDNAVLVGLIDAKAILGSPIAKALDVNNLLAVANKNMKAEGINIQVQDIKRIVMVATDYENEPVAYFEMNKAIKSLKDIADSKKVSKSSKYKGVDCQEFADGPVAAMLSGTIVLMGQDDSVKAAIDGFQGKKGTTVKCSDKMKKTFASLNSQKNFFAMEIPKDASAGLAQMGMDFSMDVASFSFAIADKLSLNGVIGTENPEQASQMAMMIPGMVSMFKMQMQGAPAMLAQQESAIKKQIADGDKEALADLKELQVQKKQMEAGMSLMDLLGAVKFAAQDKDLTIKLDMPKEKVVSMFKPMIDQALKEMAKE
ncbi:MAG: hypothetical protein JEZ07_04300 [Phycisphaerae bacterium]|nr:hypothetical protein [Phycisphaerae bacterium]